MIIGKPALIILGVAVVVGITLTFTDMHSPVWKFTVTAAVVAIGLYFWFSGNRQD